MEIMGNDIVLQYVGSSSINIFSIKFGEAVCIFAPHPQNEHVKFIDSNKGSFHCSIEPWWVKCVSYHTEKKDIALINENISLFRKWGIFPDKVGKTRKWFLFPFKTGRISQKDIDKLDGGEIRLMNILIARLKGEQFLELNLVGLAPDSIEEILNFIIYDISVHRVAYLVVVYTETHSTCKNPIQLCEKNDIKTVLNELDYENRRLKLKKCQLECVCKNRKLGRGVRNDNL